MSSRPAPSAPPAAAPVRNAPAVRAGRFPGLLGGIGEAVGGAFGLGQLGKRAGDWLGRITGMGAYKINSNTIASGPPLFGPTGAIRIRHREYLGDISSSTSFTNTTYPINPGLYSTFPFLSSLAQNYQEYRFHGLVFYFNSTSATALNSTNTALGTVVMSTNYNSIEPAFTSKVQMEAYEFTDSANPSVSIVHPIECDPRQNVLGELYVRTGAVESGADQRLYDVGLFQLATTGMQAASNIGELWVSYDVTLMKPKLPDNQVTSDLQWAHVKENPAASAAAAAPLGTSGGLLLPSSTLPIVTTNTTFTLPYAGTFYVTMVFHGSVTNAPSVNPGVNITGYNILEDGSNSAASAINGGNALVVYFFSVSTSGTGAANTITLGTGSGQSAGTTDLFVSSFPPNATLRLNTFEKLVASTMDKIKNSSFEQPQTPFLVVDEERKEIPPPIQTPVVRRVAESSSSAARSFFTR